MAPSASQSRLLLYFHSMQTGIVRRKFGRIILSIIITLGTGYFLYRAGQWLFTIQSIEVVGDSVRLVIDEQRISRNLIFFPSENMRTEILSDNPLLSDIQFQKKFPNTLRVVPILRKPIVRLRSGTRMVLVDKEGVVLADGDSGLRLPLVEIVLENIRVGEKIVDPRALLAIAVIESFPGDIPVESMTDQEGSYFLAKSPELNIFIPQDKDAKETLATLQTLLTGFRIKGTLPTVVDLRFDKPIVKF